MATLADVRRIALALPGTAEAAGTVAYSVVVKGKSKGYAWSWKERVEPRKPRVPNLGVLAVRVANLGDKDIIIASDAKKFFTEPHYNGFPAILVRLDAVTVADLKVLLHEAWRCMSPDVANATRPVGAKATRSATKTAPAKRRAARPAARSPRRRA